MCPTRIPIRIAIVAAMEREVAALVRGWTVRVTEHEGRRYRLFEGADAALICGGIGAECARRATEAMIREVNPVRVISVGFAGALDGSLRVGDVIEPQTVINVADGVRTEIGAGAGILVTSAGVADAAQKARFAKAYAASAVDMEAGAVAQGALARGVEFGALKAISDAAEFNLPALDGFVGADGSFRTVGFGFYVALRPWLWATTIALAQNSSKASRALCDALTSYLARQNFARAVSSNASLEAELNPIGRGSGFAGAHTGAGGQVHTQAESEATTPQPLIKE
jgi:adenosylhomocysteine nucleosidase